MAGAEELAAAVRAAMRARDDAGVDTYDTAGRCLEAAWDKLVDYVEEHNLTESVLDPRFYDVRTGKYIP